MRAYLSGPMTGYPDNNYPAFETAAKRLREADFEVYSPHEWEQRNNNGVFNLQIAFADYCYYISRVADMVVVLDGWKASPGATAEVALARALNKPVYYFLSNGELRRVDLSTLWPLADKVQ